jgi:hypothetical protein
MKTKFFAALIFTLTINHLSLSASAKTAFPSAPNAKVVASKGGDPTDIRIVFSAKRIWLVADEMPMKCLKAQVKNAAGEVVVEKCFSSKTSDWSLNVEALPKGDYTLHLGTTRTEKFTK